MALLLAACGPRGSVEDQVIAAIDTMAAAVEEGRVLDAMALVADDFEGRQGRVMRKDLLGLLSLQRNRFNTVAITRLPAEVSTDGGNFATARFQVLLTGGQGWLPERGRAMQVETTWLREGGDWLLWRADWTEVGD